jgi:hypothetical protein
MFVSSLWRLAVRVRIPGHPKVARKLGAATWIQGFAGLQAPEITRFRTQAIQRTRDGCRRQPEPGQVPASGAGRYSVT